MNTALGIGITLLHTIIVIMAIILLLFSNSLLTVGLLLVGAGIIFVLQIIFYGCPLSLIEKNLIGKSAIELTHRYLPFIKINNGDSKLQELQLHYIFVFCTFAIIKFMLLLFKHETANMVQIINNADTSLNLSNLMTKFK